MLLVIVFKCPISYREILFHCCHFDLSHSGSFLLISSDPWMPLLIVRLWRTPGSHSLASGACWQQSGNFSWKTCVCRGVLLKMVWEKGISCLLFEMGERLRQVKSSWERQLWWGVVLLGVQRGIIHVYFCIFDFYAQTCTCWFLMLVSWIALGLFLFIACICKNQRWWEFDRTKSTWPV